MPPSRPFRPNRPLRGIAVVTMVVLAGLALLFGFGGYYDRDPVHVFAPTGAKRPMAAMLMSGDLGLRFGAGPAIARMLAAHGTEVVGIKSPVLFRFHRSRAEVDAIVADAVRTTLARTGGGRIVLIGQSYGADILQTGLAALPAALRAHVAGVVLVVPGDTVFFRADPSSLLYDRTPDSHGVATLRRLDWTPLTCLYGIEERDSVCPDLHQPNAHSIALPGGHYVDRHQALVNAYVLRAVRALG